MQKTPYINGFSKRSKAEKIAWIAQQFFHNPDAATEVLKSYWNSDEQLQQLHDEFIENAISNYYLPLGVAPNFKINGKGYTIPMAIEESSVVAAAAKAAKFWESRGGFHAEVRATEKVGQVHFKFSGTAEDLESFFKQIKPQLLEECRPLTKKMEARGGGITSLTLVNKTQTIPNYYQLHATFNTVDAMGANFINSCLEQLATTLKASAETYFNSATERHLDIIMSILSNYVPNCIVHAEVRCPVADLGTHEGLSPEVFAQKFIQAVEIAEKEPYRAVTHNKGIMNGVDAVVLATGNDFRAVEAGVHAYAARNGQYSSLSTASIEKNNFVFQLQLPLALGTVGGLTRLHPLVQWSLQLLGNPSATTLMEIVAVAGLAQNFAALSSLVSSGIQKGHMKMHLLNLLNQHQASPKQKVLAVAHFEKNTVSSQAVQDFLNASPKE
jgi:hydroxymethylglutaryl-CoA reductase